MPYNFKKPKSPEMAARGKKTKAAIIRGFGGKPKKGPARQSTRAY